MKIRILLTFAALACLAAALVGCEDDGTGPDGEESLGPISITNVIVNPKSPAPGDTIDLTAVIVSDSANVGVFPSITWSANDGTFLENGESTVRWVAPDVSTLVSVSVQAVTSINSVSRSTTVFVGASTNIIATEAGQPFLTGSTADEFFYIRSSDPSMGFEVYRYENGSVSDAVNGGLGEMLAIAPSLTASAYQLDVPPTDNLIEPINVFYNDLSTGIRTQVTTDMAEPASRRRQQYTNAALSPDGELLAIQALLPAPLSTETDSVDIVVYHHNAQTLTSVTGTHGNVRKNIIPTFSSDGNWLLFLSDRTGQNTPAQWEYYALPVNSGVVDTALTSLVQVTNSNNQVVSVAGIVPTFPLKAWNPVSPVMAIVMTTRALMQITMDAGGASTVMTAALPSAPNELVWSPDGTRLAFSDGRSIQTIPLGGTQPAVVHEASGNDLVRDLVWSPDQTRMVYRVTRGGGTWFEIKDITDPSSDPVVLTPSSPVGDLGAYRNSMSMSPVWLPSDELLLLRFEALADTPALDILDVGAALE